MDADLDSASINIDNLKELIPEYTEDTSGIWQPIIIKSNDSTLNKVDFLMQAGDETQPISFSPLSCSPAVGSSYSYLQSNSSFSCDYCKIMEPVNFNSQPWQLKDSQGNTREVLDQFGNRIPAYIISDCTNGACDTRMQLDDFVPKIPVLNQNYLKKFYDFKYLQQFPATTNPGLGFDNFISIDRLASFSDNPKLVIDWKIKDTISEISYDKLTSQYENEYQHNKAFKKSKLVSQTCGNFILTRANPDYTGILPYYPRLSGLVGDPDQSNVSSDISEILPSVEDFTTPYGFNNSTYNNIFIKNQKLASYWKWNYESGVLCWYRYYDKDRADDPRPISGVDLYISPGDVFFATNEGPEPAPVAYNNSMDIKPCPSGLKVLNNRAVDCVIPSGSSFTYISQNLYSKFINIYNRISAAAIKDNQTISIKKKFELAALLSTAPEYDEITVDLMLRNNSYSYTINDYFQIKTLNKNMLEGTSYGSVAHLNYIKDKTDLINTLADKYGAYLWCPPLSTTTIKFKKPIDSQCLIDMDFDAVCLNKDTKLSNIGCQSTTDCSDNLLDKTFAYAQKINLGQSSLELKLDTKTRYSAECVDAEMKKLQSAKIAGMYLNNNLIKEVTYNSGCYIFQDNYPRILTRATPTDTCCNGSGFNCSSCDKDSTYYLVGGEALCKNYQGDLSWCDAPSARFYNNSDGPNIIGDRPARNILNNTLYFKRSYSSVVFDPHIDNVAFHHQGGIYCSNKFFGSLSGTTVFTKGSDSLFDDSGEGSLSISFSTKDIGIKIYALKIEKLRGISEDSYMCRAFPIKDKCKCFGLTNIGSLPYICPKEGEQGPITFTNNPILYTPNISTTFSPKIKAYGGYTEKQINEMLGGGEISNKIKVLRKEIESLNQTINFMRLADLSYDMNGNSLESFIEQRLQKSGEIDSLSFDLVQYRIPNHPDPENDLPILNKYIDPIKPYGDDQSVTIALNNYVTTNYIVKLPSYNTIHADIWAKISENIDFSTKRYATKATINDVILYDQQKKLITTDSNNSTSINIKLTNPYLEALLGSEYTLYPPIGSLCTKSGNFGSPGDEISTINITFSRIPRKQLLSFYIREPKHMGILKKGFFHPNSGLIDRRASDPALTPIHKDKNNNIFLAYDKEAFDPEASFSDQGIVYYAEINDSVKRIIQQIGQFSNHRKPRLYLKLNNLWYEYKNPNLFGYYNHNILNIGEPFIFEYLDNEKNYSVIGPWLPTAAKKHIDFNFIYNYPNKNIPISYKQNIVTKNISKPTEIILDGTRPYFFVRELDAATVSLANSIEDLSIDDQANISNENPELILANKERYKYISGPKNQKSSYIISNYNYLYHNFSDLHINYNLKNITNYIYNTKKLCNQKITIIDAKNTKKSYDSKIIEKKLYATYVDEYGNQLNLDNTSSTTRKYIKIFTYFILDKPLKYDSAYIDFTCLYNNFNNTEGIDSFILLRNLQDNQALKKETNFYLNNNLVKSKWGDLLDFDSNITSELTKYFINQKYLYNVYPSSIYLNNFYKTIINNGNYINHQLILKTGEDSLRLSISDDIYFNIHQKYNIDYEKYLVQYDYLKHHNFLPYMDINILPTDNDTNSVRSQISDHLNTLSNNIFSGLLNISGLYQNLSSNHSWEEYLSPSEGKYFWLNLNTNNTLTSTLSPKTGFYADSLRINSPAFQLNRIEYTQQRNNATSCRTTHSTPNAANSLSFDSITFNFEHFNLKNTGSVFDISNIYCDKDFVSGCSNADCNISVVGTGIYSGEYNFYTHKDIKILPNNNDIPYIISYDAGLYNPLGNMSLSYITRHELDSNNLLFPLSLCDSSVDPRPTNYGQSILNEEYQSILTNSINNDHSDIVKNTDIIANEMLFRLLYGENQKINYERIDGSNNRVKLEDLFRYVYPKTEPKDLYKNIQYDMDITADCSTRKINGSISINGILRVGQSSFVNINNKIISLNIESNNSTIDIVANCDDKTIRSILYRTKNISQQVVVATNPLSPSSSNENYELVETCKERRQLDIHLTHKITNAELTTAGCSYDENGNRERVRAYFPYWKYTGAFADGQTGEPEYPDGKLCPFSEFGPVKVGGCGRPGNDLDIYFIDHGTCNAQGGYAFPFTECTNRGVGPLNVPANCNEIVRVQADNMRITEYSRAVMSSSVCHIGGSLTQLQDDGPNTRMGPVESLVSTVMFDDTVGVSFNPRYQTDNCGICFTLDHKSWSGNDTYNKFGREFPIGWVSTNDACECADYTYGYCRNSQDASSCICSSLNYNNYTEFDYTFGYCKHSITLKGHKRRPEGKLSNPDIITDNIPTNLCDPSAGRATGFKYTNNNDDPNLIITEQCLWYYCNRAEPDRYYIYNKTTTTNNNPYNPICAQLLCNILYDNNTINITLGGSSSNTLCIPVEIRNDCPSITVTVPDDSYSVIDSIESECSNAEVSANRAVMIDQHPSWDIVTETRTCVLGYILQGNPNENGPVGDMGGATVLPCGVCTFCPKESCVGNTKGMTGYGLCGKNAPDSYPWHICISKLNEGYVCIKGNYHDRFGSTTSGYTGYPSVVGCDIPVNYPIETSNPQANDLYYREWESNMRQLHKNIAACNTMSLSSVFDETQSQVNPQRIYNTADIVEGVVPNSCSDVLFTTVTYPGIKFRTGINDPIIQDHTITVKVAYYTYAYRRPRTIQDILKGEEISKKCNELATLCNNSPLKVTSNYLTKDCDTSPICYNTNMQGCANNNYCCKTGKITYE